MKNALYSIPAALPFSQTLAQWVLEAYGGRPEHLSRVLMLLPSRRAARSLREAFLQASGGEPLLLPRMQPLGDVDEDMLLMLPGGSLALEKQLGSAFAFRRLFVLARLIRNFHASMSGHPQSIDHALRLGSELTRLLDELEREQVSLDNLASLVPDGFAEHWQITVEFLHILGRHWPEIAKEEGLKSPETHRAEMLVALAAHWQAFPPDYPVIAAGTTGSVPATAGLLKTISMLPEGKIILPGLDTESDENYFTHITESHPQWGMQQLLQKLGIQRKQVDVITAPAVTARTLLLREVMRPAETSDAWQKLTLDMDAALHNVEYITCAHLQEEASVIALILREALEQSGKTAALVTHDRALARRVSAIMERFSVTLDDSGGIELAQTPPASLMRLILSAAQSNRANIDLLSLLKHPLCTAGMERIACLEAARELEINVFRRPIAKSRAADNSADVQKLLANVEQAFAPLAVLFANQAEAPLSTLVAAHLACAEMLGGESLWKGPEADALATFLSDLQIACKEDDIAVMSSSYPGIFDALLAGKLYRPHYGLHPRLKILSPLEARMQSFDRIILGGLNEGSWPVEPSADPWFNRAMRGALGLQPHEQRIGLAAHDFYLLAHTPELFLTRSEKIAGQPTTPARWLVTLDALLAKFPHTQQSSRSWKHWVSQLDAAEKVTPCERPAPTPPYAARPREVSVTKIEMWQRDPYGFYAQQILRLRKLEALGALPTVADFGNAVHKALEDFVKAHPAQLPQDAYSLLLEYGRAALAPFFSHAAVGALWWPRFERIAAFIIEQEHIRRPYIKSVLTEKEVSMELDNFVLKGRADRVEENSDGSIAIIDYKTGSLPTSKDIEDGLASQLILLGLIMGDSPDPQMIKSLEYWQLQGGDDAGKIKPLAGAKIPSYIDAAREGLLRLIKTYDNPDFPYRATPIPARALRYNDYEHLARNKEWG